MSYLWAEFALKSFLRTEIYKLIQSWFLNEMCGFLIGCVGYVYDCTQSFHNLNFTTKNSIKYSIKIDLKVIFRFIFVGQTILFSFELNFCLIFTSAFSFHLLFSFLFRNAKLNFPFKLNWFFFKKSKLATSDWLLVFWLKFCRTFFLVATVSSLHQLSN